MNYQVLLSLSCLTSSLLFAAEPGAGDGNWPREIDSGTIHLVIYQPQVDSWKDNRIEARSAVIVIRREDPTQMFGTVSINARTEVDRETRLVALEDITIKDANFPSAASLQPTLVRALRDSVSDGWYQQNNSGQWQRRPANPGLEQQRDSRSLGQSRQREFENRGQSPGVPRTTAPPRGAPSRPTAPPHGRGRG